MRRALAILLVVPAILLAGCGGSTDDGDADAPPAAAPTEASSTEGCSDVALPEARDAEKRTAPKERLDPGKSYGLVFETNCGSFTVTLDPGKAPATTASLVALASTGFYDDTIFHRIVPGFVIQGGDPTQTGGGGPGYTTTDVPPSDASYTSGVVAMAKTSAEPAGAAQSQFFVVTGDDVVLAPEYAIVGDVTSGIDVIDRIGELGDPATQQPTRAVVISSVTVVVQ